MRLKQIVLGFAIAGLAASVGVTVPAPASAQTTFTFSTFIPMTHLINRAMVEWMEEVEKTSNGRLKFNVLTKAVAAPAGTFDGVRDGLADISWANHGYTPARFKVAEIADIPGIADKAESASVAYQRIYDRHLKKANEHAGLHVLAVFVSGPADIYTTNKPIKTVADAQGMKIRTGSPSTIAIAKGLGMNGILKPATELYEILSTGVVDGTFAGMEGITAFKLEKVIKYRSQYPGGYWRVTAGIVMNDAVYKKLSAADKKVIDSASGEKLARRVGAFWDKADQAAVEAMKANNIQMVKPDQALIDKIQSLHIENTWLESAKEKGLDGPKVLKEFRDEIKKVSTGS
jgi:TRAP-type C4-dicarboxylate transport system substrate-binding protein